MVLIQLFFCRSDITCVGEEDAQKAYQNYLGDLALKKQERQIARLKIQIQVWPTLC